MSGVHDEADYLGPGARAVRHRPAWQRLGLPIVAIVASCAGIAAAIGFSTEKLYEAEAQVELIVPESADPETMPLPGERIVAVRTSPVATRAATELELVTDQRFLTAHPQLDNSTMGEAERLTRAAAILLRGSGASLDDDGLFVSITYRAADPWLATQVANAMADAFVIEDANQVSGSLGESRQELEALVAEVRGELETAERALAENMSEADILALPSAETELVALDGSDAMSNEARMALTTELATVSAELDRIEAEIASGQLDSRDPVIARLQDSRAALEAEYERITEQFRADYPAARDLRERIAAVDQSLSREAVRLAEDRAEQQMQLTMREQQLQAQLAQLGGEVEARAAAGGELGTLQQEVIAKRELYSLLLQRLALADTDEVPTTARVIAPAVLPVRPVTPDWYLLVGIAAGAALLLSLLLLAYDARRRRR
ncbi:hypothetical protein OZN62_00900 [Aurantiacibacter sp. MUD11]|uniref:GumC family protein n=1 Tax=Aurantiacibacter sp. MUD11 TaxID=3003265 RepID=UPI0022AB4724|nr:hypothetical protein [Aurantiacibacter sp. MUD11]WAT18168.1 hypothetical protein OZN62_00900 [Aurantiacibacter sp. MUD11]